MKPDTPSRTALLIARSLVFTSADRKLADLVPRASVELARAALPVAAPATAWLDGWLSAPGLNQVVRGLERLVLPGIQLHYALRKRYIAEVADRAVADGVHQLVVIGAGFDGLALGLARGPERIACIEVDHPATQAVKRRALARLGGSTGDLRLVPADLAREPLADALARGGFDPEVRTLFVAEGLTMYLDSDAVERLLRGCAAAAAGSRFVWSFMEPDATGRLAFRSSRKWMVDAWLRVRREPFTWGARPAAVPDLVRRLGFEPLETVGAAELRARYLAPRGIERDPAAGEHLCLMSVP